MIHNLNRTKFAVVKNILDNVCCLTKTSALSKHTLDNFEPYFYAVTLLSLVHEAPEAHSQETFSRVELDNLLVIHSSMPQDIMLNENQDSGTDSPRSE